MLYLPCTRGKAWGTWELACCSKMPLQEYEPRVSFGDLQVGAGWLLWGCQWAVHTPRWCVLLPQEVGCLRCVLLTSGDILLQC